MLPHLPPAPNKIRPIRASRFDSTQKQDVLAQEAQEGFPPRAGSRPPRGQDSIQSDAATAPDCFPTFARRERPLFRARR
jgi:hypothetical protein